MASTAPPPASSTASTLPADPLGRELLDAAGVARRSVAVTGALRMNISVLEPDGKNIDGTIKWKERDVRRFQVQRVH